MFFSKLFIAIGFTAGAVVNAFPNHNADIQSRDIYENHLVTRGRGKNAIRFGTTAAAQASKTTYNLPPNFKDTAYRALMKKYNPKKRLVFHSGIGPAQAIKYAKDHNAQTVEQILAEALQEDKQSKQNLFDPVAKYFVTRQQWESKGQDIAEWRSAWDIISELWAQLAKDNVTLLLPRTGTKSTSFWARVEYPILLNNHVRILREMIEDVQKAAEEKKAAGKSTVRAPKQGNRPQGVAEEKEGDHVDVARERKEAASRKGNGPKEQDPVAG